MCRPLKARPPAVRWGGMGTPDRELRLGLEDRRLVFPNGAPYCLVCGRRPAGTRTLAFKDVDYANRQTEGANLLLQRVHPLLAWANRARLVTFKIEAPLCLRHRWRGRGLEIGVIAFFILATAALVWLGLKGRLPSGPSETGSLLKGLLIAIVLVPGYLLWKKGRKAPVLPCEVRRESPSSIVLTYPDGAPGPR